VPDMPVARQGHLALALENGKVLVTGGFDDNGPLSSAVLFDPISRTWSSTASMSTARKTSPVYCCLTVRSSLAGGNPWRGRAGPLAEWYDSFPTWGPGLVTGPLWSKRGGKIPYPLGGVGPFLGLGPGPFGAFVAGEIRGKARRPFGNSLGETGLMDWAGLHPGNSLGRPARGPRNICSQRGPGVTGGQERGP